MAVVLIIIVGEVEEKTLYLRQAVDMSLIHKLIVRWVDAALVNAEEVLIGKICVNDTKKTWVEKEHLFYE